MKKFIFFSFLFIFFVMLNVKLYSQQCEVITNNITFESVNSVTFDVYIKNTGLSTWTYSHGTTAWTYDLAFLNGGVPTFSLVPGFSDFPAGAYPPSALITNPNILRTSSNMPGANGDVLPGQTLRLYRFRLQTSAASFSSDFLNLVWKNDVTPYTRIYGWNSGNGLPGEITGLDYTIEQFFWEENFNFTGLLTDNGWTAHSGGTTNPISTTTGLAYTGYLSSGIGNAASLNNTGQDVNRIFPTQTSGTIYFSLLVNVTTGTAGYFLHLGTGTSTFAARIFVQPSATAGKINFGLSNSSTANYAVTPTDFDPLTTYLVIVKYEVSTDGNASLWVLPSGIPATEPAAGTPEITTTGTGQASIDGVYLRQYNSSQDITVDGIRVGTTWADLFPAAGTPLLSAVPSSLSGFSYITGGGPSASQSYDLSGSDLTPASGDIVVTGSTNYEVSLDDVTFDASVNVGYTSGMLSSTPVYVRLKAGLTGGSYNGEIITNDGGGASTINVTCNGAVVKPEPTNHVTSFNGITGNPAYYYINLNWTDAAGGTEPDGYLIKGSTVDFASIAPPVDGTSETNNFLIQNVTQGIEAAVFGLNSGMTYYFKIYPYSNSGSLIDYKTDGTVPEFNIATTNAPSLPITENFEYATGSNLTDNGWVAHSGAGSLPIQVNASPLNYSGYVNSGLGKSVTLTAPGTSSAEDINRAFDSVAANSFYASFMVNVSSADTTGVYFFHFGPENSSTLFFGKVFVKNDGFDNLAFGVAKNSNTTATYTGFNYSLNTTYLIVVKYTFNTGSSTDDEAKLWINPVLDGNEPAADLTQTDTQPDALSFGFFALRQGSNGPGLTLGGLRVATAWIPGSGSSQDTVYVNVMSNSFDPADFTIDVGDVVKWTLVEGSHTTTSNTIPMGAAPWDYTFTGIDDSFIYEVTVAGDYNYECLFHTGMNGSFTANESNTFQLTVDVTDGWNMVSIPGLHPVNQDVTTWWADKDPAAGVFMFNNGYQAVTTVTPSEGYWMKHLGVRTYNTGDEWPAGGINIVSHDPINANAGWNLIGGYEYNAQTSGITTTPPGLVEGSVFGYSGGYSAVTELVPGYGYWIKLSGAGQINLPPSAFKGTSKLAELIKEDWGKIIISDQRGRSYTLYAVKGKINLNEFELPPVPPANIFDVRFGSNRFADDINKDLKTILMNGLEYPVVVKTENIGIKLQDETGKGLNARLKSGEEVTINNRLINKLLVTADLIPDRYSLGQNYPNPFNPSTTINFSLPKQTELKIKLYNVLGELVKTITEGLYQAGHYQVSLNAQNLPSGTYIYRLESSEIIQTKKMILLK